MTHLFVLWFALFAAQAATPATPPPSEPPATQTTQQPAAAAPSTASPDQAAPAKAPSPNSAGTHQGGVTGPKILRQPEPQYTQIARQQRITGVATVMCLINAQGNPENVHVIKSIADTVDSKHRAAALTLDQAAIDTVKKYKFTPAMQDGKPVPVYLNVKVNFDIY